MRTAPSDRLRYDEQSTAIHCQIACGKAAKCADAGSDAKLWRAVLEARSGRGAVHVAVSNGQAPSKTPWPKRDFSRTADEVSSAALRL